MSIAEDNGKESEEPDYDEDKDQLEEKQEEGNKRTGNKKSSFLNLSIGVYIISKYSVVYRKSRGIHIFRRR
jgi:hypothetical protein